MSQRKQITATIESLTRLHTMTRVYGDIASARMQKTRGRVLTSRDFLADIEIIFKEVKASYAREIAKLAKNRDTAETGTVTFLAHNGKKVAVFLSSNAGLYGSIIQRSFNLFLESIKSGETEATVVGKYGLSLFLESMPGTPYTYFDLPDYGVKESEIFNIAKHLVQYEEIHFYFGKFKNVVTQEPVVQKVKAGTEISDQEASQEKFIFEPDLEKILIYFETQLFSSTLGQTIRESQLSKSASRLLSMDSASQNIERELGIEKLRLIKAKHVEMNKKQLNTLSRNMGIV